MNPGWYQDPAGGPSPRWWDGYRWTDTVQPASPAANKPAIPMSSWVAIGSGLAAIVGSFLPWVTLSVLFATVSKSGTDGGDGFLSIGAGAVMCIFGSVAANGRTWQRSHAVMVLLAGLATLALAAYETVDIAVKIADIGDDAVASFGAGLYLLGLGGVGATAAGIAALRSSS